MPRLERINSGEIRSIVRGSKRIARGRRGALRRSSDPGRAAALQSARGQRERAGNAPRVAKPACGDTVRRRERDATIRGVTLPEPDATLDTFGRLCPVPIIMTAKRIKTLDAGQVLAVLSDDHGILEDMPLWCRSSRNDLVAIEEIAPGEWRALVRKGAGAR